MDVASGILDLRDAEDRLPDLTSHIPQKFTIPIILNLQFLSLG